MSIFTLFTSLSTVMQVSIEELPLQTLPVTSWRPTGHMGLQHKPGPPICIRRSLSPTVSGEVLQTLGLLLEIGGEVRIHASAHLLSQSQFMTCASTSLLGPLGRRSSPQVQLGLSSEMPAMV